MSEDDPAAKKPGFFKAEGDMEIQPVDALLVLGGGLDHSDDGGSIQKPQTPRWGRGQVSVLGARARRVSAAGREART